MKSPIFFVLVLILIIILTFIPACATKAAEKSVTKEVNEINEPRGNSLGNIVNKGIVVQKGDWIYYQNRDDKNRIYKIKTDGSECQKINDDSSFYREIGFFI